MALSGSQSNLKISREKGATFSLLSGYAQDILDRSQTVPKCTIMI